MIFIDVSDFMGVFGHSVWKQRVPLAPVNTIVCGPIEDVRHNGMNGKTGHHHSLCCGREEAPNGQGNVSGIVGRKGRRSSDLYRLHRTVGTESYPEGGQGDCGCSRRVVNRIDFRGGTDSEERDLRLGRWNPRITHANRHHSGSASSGASPFR